MNSNIVGALGGTAMVNPDGSISGPSYEIQGNSYSTVYDSFAAVNQNLTSIGSALDTLNGGAGIKYFHTNSSLADSQATGAHSVAIGPQSVAAGDNSFAAGNGAMAASQGAVALGAGAQANNDNDVALGAGSITQAAIGTAGVTIKGEHYDFAGTSPTGTVSVGSEGAERTITNVAAGRLSASSTDAVNGFQLYATNHAVDTLQGSVVSLNEDAVQYDRNSVGTKANRITLQGGDPNAPVVLSNVGAGVLETDAANVAQVNTAIVQSKSYADQKIDTVVDTANSYTDQVAVSTLGQATTYTDQKFGVLNQQIGAVRSEARQAAAIGLAAASLRYDGNPGKLSVSIGGGSWRGEGAFAMGAGFTSDSGRVRADLSSSAAGGHWGVGGGVSFTLNRGRHAQTRSFHPSHRGLGRGDLSPRRSGHSRVRRGGAVLSDQAVRGDGAKRRPTGKL
ncbi:MAG TPA: YadA-like family protein [Rhizomicrobium sp.]|nr:YadA-like family protein [Rhizomicrobium sp.]